MPNETSYAHVTPGGLAPRDFRPHLSRYKEPHEALRDFVTLGEATGGEKAMFLGLGVLGAILLAPILARRARRVPRRR